MCICPLCNNTHFSMLHKECRANVIERNGFVFPSRRAQHYVVISSKVSEANDTWALGSYLQGMQSLQTDRRGLKQNLFSVMKPVLQFAAQPMDVTSARIWQLKETAWALLNKLPVPKKVTSWFLIWQDRTLCTVLRALHHAQLPLTGWEIPLLCFRVQPAEWQHFTAGEGRSEWQGNRTFSPWVVALNHSSQCPTCRGPQLHRPSAATITTGQQKHSQSRAVTLHAATTRSSAAHSSTIHLMSHWNEWRWWCECGKWFFFQPCLAVPFPPSHPAMLWHRWSVWSGAQSEHIWKQSLIAAGLSNHSNRRLYRWMRLEFRELCMFEDIYHY